MPYPFQVPKRGFYYHYKHDPKSSLNNYAYEVLGLCRNTEKNDNDPERYMVLYRPLYQNTYLNPADYSIRPLGMFMESVLKNGADVPRFQQIDDPFIIKKLANEKMNMYGYN
jgi:hypothetical protein